ncbi:hypothetical protein ATANTOWER_010729 [Ataeniobius toweri]|uniref:Uncharacterized protein n=1 Tax=Ataeniobius toweri TaxID=208326 RepID=A0ABU7CGB5_9TELE|nr:hypothetical protein [Ataeniobius toweri]
MVPHSGPVSCLISRNLSCLPQETITEPYKLFLGCSPQYPTAPTCPPTLQRFLRQTELDTRILTLFRRTAPTSLLFLRAFFPAQDSKQTPSLFIKHLMRDTAIFPTNFICPPQFF